MKKWIILAMSAILPFTAMAQHEEDTENGVVSLAGREGFTIGTKKGDFVFKPYLMVQTAGNFNWYDDEGLDKAYNQDNIANSGFSIPYAVLGFTGKAFNKVTFNLSINAAASGGALLQQAWFDVKFNQKLQLRVGKFKTPFSHAYLTTLGETLLPQLPLSLTSSVIMPYSLNAVTPNIGTGFDLGIELRSRPVQRHRRKCQHLNQDRQRRLAHTVVALCRPFELYAQRRDAFHPGKSEPPA